MVLLRIQILIQRLLLDPKPQPSLSVVVKQIQIVMITNRNHKFYRKFLFHSQILLELSDNHCYIVYPYRK